MMTFANDVNLNRSDSPRSRPRKGRGLELIRLPQFDWDKAKYFYYIAKLGSFAEAGKFLNISQSGLSRKIAVLEEHLKFPLFHRLSRGVEFTPKGEELFAIVERTFMEMKEFVHSAAAEKDSSRTVIRIASTPQIVSYVLNSKLINFRNQNPHVVFELIGEDKPTELSFGNVDFIIRPYDPKSEHLIQEPLFSLGKKLYASPEYLEEFGTPETPEDLKEHRLVGPCISGRIEYPYADIFWRYRLGLPRGKLHKPVYSSNNLECIVEAAKRGLGIIAGYDSMSLIQQSGLKQILPEFMHVEQPLYMIYSPYLKKDPEMQKFIDYIHRLFTKTPDQLF